MKIYLVRHGQKENLIGDPSLSEIGIKQAEMTGEFLKNKNISQIFASPLKRTQMTAGIISKKINLDFKTDSRLKERMNWGDKPDQKFEDFIIEWEKSDKDRNYKPTPGDSSIETGNRIKAVLDEIEEAELENNILVVTHGGAIGDFLLNNFSEARLPIVENYSNRVNYVEILECSVTVLNKNNNLYKLEKVGNISHLEEILI